MTIINLRDFYSWDPQDEVLPSVERAEQPAGKPGPEERGLCLWDRGSEKAPSEVLLQLGFYLELLYFDLKRHTLCGICVWIQCSQ